jgi:hypothetical protein
MKERPILMSGPLVREILAGRKTQTRRPVKPDPWLDKAGWWFWNGPGPGIASWRDGEPPGILPRCPYGAPGDRLWVRETLRRGKWDGSDDAVFYAADGEPAWDVTRPATWVWKRPALPSIYMPRGLSRLTLDVVAVGVERLASIVDLDAEKEGVADRAAFVAKWKEIYGAESWDANPWVWVIEFRPVPPESA